MKYLFIAFLSLLPSFASAQVSSSGGRFQVLQLSTMRRDQVMIDSQTGKIWNRTCMVMEGENCIFSAWVLDNIEGVTTTKAEIDKTTVRLEKLQAEQKK